MNTIDAVSDATRDQINAALESNLRPVTRWSSPVVAVCAVDGGAVTVTHDLGLLPNKLSVEPWVDGRWWRDADDLRLWNDRIIIFHASAAGQYTVRVGIQ